MRSLLLLALALTGCKAVPEPPGDFAALAPYLFEHHADEDPAALAAGLDQLAVWLDEHHEEAADGYAIAPPTEEAFDAMDEVDRTTEDMVGLSMASVSAFSVEDNTWALVSVDQDEIFPKTFDAYERTWEVGDDACFTARECERCQCLEELESSFALGLESESTARNQYLWVEMGRGLAMVHRNWQVEPPVVNSSLLEVDEQAYLNLFLPEGSGAYRLQAQWTVYAAGNGTPEDMASQLVIDFFQGTHDDLEAWLGENL